MNITQHAKQVVPSNTKWAFTTHCVHHADVSIIEKINLKELKMNIASSKINRLIMVSMLSLLVSSYAQAEDCSSSLGDVAISENLVVPQNAVCNLDGTRVDGNIEVKAGATLNAQRILVDGNIQAENALAVNVQDRSRVDGSIQLEQGGSAIISDTIIDGNLQFESNDGLFQALRNDIAGDFQVFQNQGEIEIVGNVVDGNLQCKENDSIPFGGGNRVDGNMEDQCAQLQVRVSSADNCDKSNATYNDDDDQLHIPRISVPGQTDIEDYAATLRHIPEFSRNGSLVFEVVELDECD